MQAFFPSNDITMKMLLHWLEPPSWNQAIPTWATLPQAHNIYYNNNLIIIIIIITIITIITTITYAWEVLAPNGGALKWRTALALTSFYLDISLFSPYFAFSFNFIYHLTYSAPSPDLFCSIYLYCLQIIIILTTITIITIITANFGHIYKCTHNKQSQKPAYCLLVRFIMLPKMPLIAIVIRWSIARSKPFY